MTDRNGNTLAEGMAVMFQSRLADAWVEGVVRKVRTMSYYNNFEQRLDVDEALVEGERYSGWVESEAIKVGRDA